MIHAVESLDAGLLDDFVRRGTRRVLVCGDGPQAAGVPAMPRELNADTIGDEHLMAEGGIGALGRKMAAGIDALVVLSTAARDAGVANFDALPRLPEVVAVGPRAERAVLMAFQKSGTNLISKLVQTLGYTPVGHGIMESYPVILTRVAESPHAGDTVRRAAQTLGAAFVAREAQGPRGFGEVMSLPEARTLLAFVFSPEFAEFYFAEFPPRTCLVVHQLGIDGMIAKWCQTGTPPLLFHYRDPRDTIISFIYYLMGRARGPMSPSTWNTVQGQILAGLPTMGARFDYVMRHMSDFIRTYADHAWLYFHPAVCKTSFESLVGTDGGGDDAGRERTVAKVMLRLGVSGEPAEVARCLTPSGARTFRRGQPAAWREELEAGQIEEFKRRYSDILELYGYA